jgi:hypothetical protein
MADTVMTNEEAKNICLQASYHLQFIADRATAGYWDDNRAEYHLSEMKEKFELVAGILGYELSKGSE